MAHTKGFSLIETLVAITIASIATIALMRIISYTSSTSANAIKHFDSSIMMSLVAGGINDSLNGRIMNVDEIVGSRYQIDHPAIRESLQIAAYEIRLLPKEIIDPLMTTNFNMQDSTSKFNSITLQKVILQNSQEQKSFYRLSTDNR